MSYPFTNQAYAQHGSESGGHGANAYGSSSAAPIQHGLGANAHYDPSSYDSNSHDMRERERRSYEYGDENAYGRHQQPDDVPSPLEKDSSKMYNEGNSPYGVRNSAGDDTLYAGNSIWSREDKRAMGKRSLPVKLIRMLSCLVINAIIVILCIISLVVIFARPINVGIGTMTNPSAGSVGVDGTALTFNGSVDFIVSNPNSISSDLTLTAKVYDIVNKDQDIGRGSVENKKIEANSNTTITFPYQVRYDSNADKSKVILKDLASKCGLTGSSTGQLDLSLSIDAKVKILSVPVPVSFSQPISFQCPISGDVLKSIGGGDLLQIIGSLTSKRSSAWGHIVDGRSEL